MLLSVGTRGCGFVIRPPFVGIDLDDCRDGVTGAIKPEAEAIVHKLDSYTEISPSGEGLHILVRGYLPETVQAKPVEMYGRRHYFTYTGDQLSGTPSTVNRRLPEVTRVV